MSRFDIVNFALASAVANAGTVTVGYPSGRSKGSYTLADSKHVLSVGGNIYQAEDSDITLTFNANASGITLTNTSGNTWPAGAVCALQLNLNGSSRSVPIAVDSPRVQSYREVLLDLGSPVAGDPDGLQTGYTGAVGAIPLNGALVGSDGIAVFDVPRGIVVDSGGADTSVITVTGTDEYGNVLVENITTNGATAVLGKKAFKTVTALSGSVIAANGIFIGTSNVLGLPLAVRKAGQVLKELQDGAAAVAGTFAYALSNTVNSATAADVRGTYTPNATPDGDKGFAVLVSLPDPSDIGVDQFAG